MRIPKINTVHYGWIWIASGLIICAVVPYVLWLIGLFKRQHKLRSVGISFLFTLAGSAAGYFIMQLLDVLSDTFLG